MDPYIKTHTLLIEELNRIRKYLYELKNSKESCQIYYLMREFDDWFLENVSFRPQPIPDRSKEDTVQRFTIGDFTP